MTFERREAPDERDVRAAWIKWYGEAIESVRALPVTGASSEIDMKVAAAIRALPDSATR